MSERYAMAPNGVFTTVQGECALSGVPMHFVRLAGCSVGCEHCDTDYTVAERLGVAEIVERLQRLKRQEWVWITGGEPTDQGLGRLVDGLRVEGYRVALATAGVRTACRDGWQVREGRAGGGVDFLSVSPHFADDRWRLRGGTQLNVGVGLNGLRLDAFAGLDRRHWNYLWVTPVWVGGGVDADALAECVAWVQSHRHWRLNIQAHKHWRLP